MSTIDPGLAAMLAELLETHYMNRIDRFPAWAHWGSICPAKPVSEFREVTRAHVTGEVGRATVTLLPRSGPLNFDGPHRIGSYEVSPDGRSGWLCLDFDAHGRAEDLVDPLAAAMTTMDALRELGFRPYLEQSAGGAGWHVWVFFADPVPAHIARAIGVFTANQGLPLKNGLVADPSRNLGVEVFPKTTFLRPGGVGNLVWLPLWRHGATDLANQFHRVGTGGQLNPFIPDGFEVSVVSQEFADYILAETGVESSPPCEPTGERTDMQIWREKALAKVSLKAVFGEFLTDIPSGHGFLKCHDPAAGPGGDREPSASVATGEGDVERGRFKSFRTGERLSLLDYMKEYVDGVDTHGDALRRLAYLSGVPLPPRKGGSRN